MHMTSCKYLKAKQVAHDNSRGPAHLLAELCKVIEVCLVERVPHDFDVHLVQVLVRQVFREVRRQRCIYQHQAEELAHVLCHCQRGYAVEHP